MSCITCQPHLNRDSLAGRPMTVRIAINGFGRIGRNVVRALYESGRRNYRGTINEAGGCRRHGAFVEI